jgi:hypothetical protein
VHDAFLEQLSSGTLIINRLERRPKVGNVFIHISVSAIKVTVTDTVVKHYLELDKGVSYLINDFCFIDIYFRIPLTVCQG